MGAAQRHDGKGHGLQPWNQSSKSEGLSARANTESLDRYPAVFLRWVRSYLKLIPVAYVSQPRAPMNLHVMSMFTKYLN